MSHILKLRFPLSPSFSYAGAAEEFWSLFHVVDPYRIGLDIGLHRLIEVLQGDVSVGVLELLEQEVGEHTVLFLLIGHGSLGGG